MRQVSSVSFYSKSLWSFILSVLLLVTVLAWTGCSSGTTTPGDNLSGGKQILAKGGNGGGGGGKPGGGEPPPTTDSAIVFNGGSGALGFRDADGTNLAVLDGLPGNGGANWSPDAQKILFYDRSGKRNRAVRSLYTINIDGSGLTTLIAISESDAGLHPSTDWSPVETPDGNFKIAYGVRPINDHYDIWLMNDDGSGATNLTNTPGMDERFPSFSPDGIWLAYSRADNPESPSGPYVVNVWVHNLQSGEAINVTAGSPISGYHLHQLDWSRTQDKIALQVYDGSDLQIWVVDINNPLNPFNLTAAAGAGSSDSPTWSPDDSEILFMSGDCFIVNADGTNLRVFAPTPTGLTKLDWKR